MIESRADPEAAIDRAPARPATAVGPLLRLGRAAHAVGRSARISRENLQAYQSARLRRVFEHAYERVPYYRRRFDAHGIAPRHIRGLEDLTRIPLTTRRDLQSAAPEELVPRGVDPGALLASTTSGSSGRPLTVRRSWLENSALHLFRLRGYRRMGVRLRDHRVMLARFKPPKPGDYKLAGAVIRRLGLLRVSRVDLFCEAQEMAAQLCSLRPDVVQGFPTTLLQVAEQLASTGRQGLRPRLVLAMGEVLTGPARTSIAEAFGASVIEEYGCHELNQIAWQCPASSDYHTVDDSLIVEVRNATGSAAAPGESGEVVATSLYQYAMPLIRYAPGDLAVRASDGCACGTAFASIAGIEGRSLDLFTLPDGRVIHPFKVLYGFVRANVSWIGKYQLVQTRRDHVEFRVVPIRPPTEEQLQHLRSTVGEALGSDVGLDLELVADIPADPNGKLRPCRSLVTG